MLNWTYFFIILHVLQHNFAYLKHMSHLMTKPTKWVHPVKTQISLGIRTVWSVVTVHMKKAWVLNYPMSAQQRLWSDWVDAQADLSLRWGHSHFVGFGLRWLIYPVYMHWNLATRIRAEISVSQKTIMSVSKLPQPKNISHRHLTMIWWQ